MRKVFMLDPTNCYILLALSHDGAIFIALSQLCQMKESMTEEEFEKKFRQRTTTSKVFLKTSHFDDDDEYLDQYSQKFVDFSSEPHFHLKVTNDQGVTWLEFSSLPTCFEQMKFIFDSTNKECTIEVVGLYWLNGQEGSALEVLLHREKNDL